MKNGREDLKRQGKSNVKQEITKKDRNISKKKTNQKTNQKTNLKTNQKTIQTQKGISKKEASKKEASKKGIKTEQSYSKTELEETARIKMFRERKAKELRRRKRNRLIFRVVVGLFLVGIILFVADKLNVRELRGEAQKQTEESSVSIETTLYIEETTQETSTLVETTEEPTTEAADPREDVWTHYQNMFVVRGMENYLNIRDTPSRDGNIIGKLVKYAGGELLEDLGNGWSHIRSGEIDGYVATEYCAVGEEAKNLALKHCYEMVRVTAERLNVRSGPGEQYETFMQLNSAELQVVEAKEGDWLKIAIGNSYGYIHEDYTVPGYYLVEAMPWSSISNYSPARQALFAYASQFIGTPYVYGGTDLWHGIDCSSYVQQCFKNALGISLPRTSREQVNQGIEISLAQAKPGDLLFYADPMNGVIDHVVMYMGDGKILHAAQSLGQVIVSKYNYNSEPVAVRNIIGD